MDDSCAVCADSLEWVAYGSCGHREVCSTCVIRLRFVLDDRRCCICKTECSAVFVTKAMGDYTRVISDFSVFPAGATEGRTGEYWYHEDTQVYFDDVDQYKMIKAMCRLSCSVCDKNAEEHGSEVTKRRNKFRSIEQLKGHLFHQHKLFMCNLCLEGRKVFICEQKLYTRSQLTQHINSGNSDVDGSESERGGFMGHPMCEFCRSPFYGENELYTHMSTEHYTCHICQRQHPGQYDYFKNYDDLEMHFRQEHFLCEDEGCLAKKFVVFPSEAEMKRHNAIEHGGHMSRSQRNAALQIPTSFRYRRNEQDQRRGRGRGFRLDPSGDQLSAAIQASLEMAHVDARARETSSVARPVSERVESQNDAISGSVGSLHISPGSVPPSRSTPTQSQSSISSQLLEESSFPPLVDRDLPEPSVRYAQAVQIIGRPANLGEESFPPLPGSKKSGIQKAKQGSVASGRNTLAARLNSQNRGSASDPYSGPSKSAENYGLGPFHSQSSPQIRAPHSHGSSSSTSTSSQPWAAATAQGVRPSSSILQVKSREGGFLSPSSSTSTWNLNERNRMKHSSSAPELVNGGLSSHATSSVAAVVTGPQLVVASNQSSSQVEDVQTANKSLVERMRAALGMDEDKYAAFKSISAEFRQDLISTWEYLSCVQQFGLSHLVPELARLCPDGQKQKELMDAYHVTLRGKGPLQNGDSNSSGLKDSTLPVKGRSKSGQSAGSSSAKDALADAFISTVKRLQTNQKPEAEEVEVLLKDGYRATKDMVQLSNRKSSSTQEAVADGASSNQNSAGGGSSKQRKKTSKFHRVRLGDDSDAALLDLGHSSVIPESADEESSKKTSEGLPVRGVWRNGGGQKLLPSRKDRSG